MLFGLVRNHPFVQGNKRTATVLTWNALERGGYTVTASLQAILDVVYGIDNEGRSVEEVAAWFRDHLTAPAPP